MLVDKTRRSEKESATKIMPNGGFQPPKSSRIIPLACTSLNMYRLMPDVRTIVPKLIQRWVRMKGRRKTSKIPVKMGRTMGNTIILFMFRTSERIGMSGSGTLIRTIGQNKKYGRYGKADHNGR